MTNTVKRFVENTVSLEPFLNAERNPVILLLFWEYQSVICL